MEEGLDIDALAVVDAGSFLVEGTARSGKSPPTSSGKSNLARKEGLGIDTLAVVDAGVIAVAAPFVLLLWSRTCVGLVGKWSDPK